MFGYTSVYIGIHRFLVKPKLWPQSTSSDALRARFSAGAAISDATWRTKAGKIWAKIQVDVGDNVPLNSSIFVCCNYCNCGVPKKPTHPYPNLWDYPGQGSAATYFQVQTQTLTTPIVVRSTATLAGSWCTRRPRWSRWQLATRIASKMDVLAAMCAFSHPKWRRHRFLAVLKKPRTPITAYSCTCVADTSGDPISGRLRSPPRSGATGVWLWVPKIWH